MQPIDRTAIDYQKLLVENGIMLGRLTIRLNGEDAWTVQCIKTRRISDETMKDLVRTFVTRKWDGFGVKFYRKHGMRESECLCNFYSSLV